MLGSTVSVVPVKMLKLQHLDLVCNCITLVYAVCIDGTRVKLKRFEMPNRTAFEGPVFPQVAGLRSVSEPQ